MAPKVQGVLIKLPEITAVKTLQLPSPKSRKETTLEMHTPSAQFMQAVEILIPQAGSPGA